MTLSCVLAASLDVADQVAMAKALGYHRAWLADSPAIWGDVWIGLAEVGSICIREAARLPELEVVGAYVYSERKEGMDVGTLAGIEPLGVSATRDVDEFLATECDDLPPVHWKRDMQIDTPIGRTPAAA